MDLIAETNLRRIFMREKVHPGAEAKRLSKSFFFFFFNCKCFSMSVIDVSKTDLGGLVRWWNIVSAVYDSKQKCRWHNSPLNCRAKINSFKNMKHVRLQKQAKPQRRNTICFHSLATSSFFTKHVTQKSFLQKEKRTIWSTESYIVT